MNALDALAERMGIELAYRDTHHRSVPTPPSTVKALLAAMGVPANDDAEARAVLDRLHRADLTRLLPPVVVVRTDRLPVRVAVGGRARGRPGSGMVRWRIETEAGDALTGEAHFDGLPLLSSGRVDGRRREQRLLTVAASLPAGYHRLTLESEEPAGPPGPEDGTLLIVVPPRCWLPPALVTGDRLWGIAAPLYLVRSARSWGIGDFTDLVALVDAAAQVGASVVGLNPLHALFPNHPDVASPYAPSSRLALNVLSIDVTAVPEFHRSDEIRTMVATPEFDRALEQVRTAPMVLYTAVTALKVTMLRLMHRAFRAGAEPERRAAFAAFRSGGGPALQQYAVFEALAHHFGRRDAGDDGPDTGRLAGWQTWPDAYHSPDSPAVAAFAGDHADEVEFRAWMQWIADQQLAVAHRRARGHGLAVGLCHELAVGAEPGGAEAWAEQRVMPVSAHVGAPPDPLHPAGQDWALPPLDPHALRQDRYAGFITLLRAAMRHADALRIDHALALHHPYWIPADAPPAQGAYVTGPVDDLVGIIALESHRHHCLVIGDDLGAAPDGFREPMDQAGILSSRVLVLEQDDGRFLLPDTYPSLAVATAGRHDLPTLRGWWEGRDIDTVQRHPDDAESRHARRRREGLHLMAALNQSGLHPRPSPLMRPSLARAIHACLARSPAALVLVQLWDLADQPDPVTLPGTDGADGNWRRRLPLPVEALTRDPYAGGLFEVMRRERPRPGSTSGSGEDQGSPTPDPKGDPGNGERKTGAER